MDEFVPFHDFRRQLDVPSEPYRGGEVVHTYVQDDGQYIDCVRTGTQGGLPAGEKVASPPDFVAATNAGGQFPSSEGPSATPRRDRFGNVMACPVGCVPVRRAMPDQPGNTGTGERYFQKAPGGGVPPPPPGP